MRLSQSMLLKEVVEHADDGVGLPMSLASQHTPKIIHLRGVRKYVGPWWRGSEG